MTAVLDEQSTAHAGTPPAAVKRKALKLLTKALQGKLARQLSLGLALAGLASPTAQELAAALLAESYQLDQAAVAEALCRLADSPHWEVREWAAVAAGHVLTEHPAEFFTTAQRWVAHPSGNVRRAAALSAMYASKARRPEDAAALLDLIEPLLADRDPYVRKNLGPYAIGDGLLPRYPDAVLARWPAWAQHPNDQVRWNAAMVFTAAAAAQHGESAQPALERLAAHDSVTAVRRAAKSALTKLKLPPR